VCPGAAPRAEDRLWTSAAEGTVAGGMQSVETTTAYLVPAFPQSAGSGRQRHYNIILPHGDLELG
jgi:hypothetical protein